MKVVLNKVHKSWEAFYPELQVGIEMEFIRPSVLQYLGKQYSAIEMCKSFSNHCSIGDIISFID